MSATLEGSVRKAGNRVRITGQLIDAAAPMSGERGLVTQDNWSKGGTMVTDKAIIMLVLGVFVTLVSASAGQAETRFYYCKQTMQYDRNAKEPSGIDPVQINFVVKDGAFSMGEVRFNGKVSISETEVTAFVDNVRYEGFVNLLHTSPTAAELTMSIMDKALYQTEPKVTTGTCGVQLR